MFALRPVTAADGPLLRRLLLDARPELAGLPEPLVDLQFRAQDRLYSTAYGTHGHRIVERCGNPVGRLWTGRGAEAIVLVDISLLSAERGAGLGTALLRQVLDSAAGVPVRLSVRRDNPRALGLYLRMGFCLTSATDTDLTLEHV